jgi:hypothetical protein
MNWATFSALKPRGQTRYRVHQRSEGTFLKVALAVVETTEAAQTRDHGAFRKLFETDNTWNKER